MRYANYGKTTVAGVAVGASPLKPASPFVYAGLGALADQIINGTIQPPLRDPGFDPGNILDQGRDDTYAAHDYLTAMLANDQVPDGVDIDRFLDKAPPYPGAPFETTRYDNG